MKKKALAILLSVLMLTSVTLPGTWANPDETDDTLVEDMDVLNESEEAQTEYIEVSNDSAIEEEPVEETPAKPDEEDVEDGLSNFNDTIFNISADDDILYKATELYKKIMSCSFIDDIWLLVEDEDAEVINALNEEQVYDIEEHIENNEPEPLPEITIQESDPPVESVVYCPTVDYTEVAPLVDAY